MAGVRLVFIVAGMSILLFSGTVFAGQFGAPEPVARYGGISLGVGYFYSFDKLEADNSKDYKVTQNQIYLQLSAAISKMEFYIRGGGADFKIDDAFGNSDFTDNYKLFGTAGIRGIFDLNPYFGIGPFIQGSLYSKYTDQNVEIKDGNEINVGFALQGRIDRILIYAGPFLYWTHAKVSGSGTGSLNESNNFGGFGGIRIPLGQGLNIELEGQYRQEFSAGGSISYSF